MKIFKNHKAFFLSFLFVGFSGIFLGACSQTPEVDPLQTEEEFEAPPEKIEEKASPSRLERYLKNGSYKRLKSEAARLLAKNPKDVKVLSILGLYHMRMKQWGAARLFFERALEEEKDLAGVHNNMAVIDLKEGHLLKALAGLQKAHRLDSSHLDTQVNLASIYVKYMDYDSAENLVEEPYENKPSHPIVANSYAVVLRSREEWDEAQSVYTKALKKNRQNVPIRLNYAILLVEYMKNYKKAQGVLDQIGLLNPRDKYILGKVRELQKKVSQSP